MRCRSMRMATSCPATITWTKIQTTTATWSSLIQRIAGCRRSDIAECVNGVNAKARTGTKVWQRDNQREAVGPDKSCKMRPAQSLCRADPEQPTQGARKRLQGWLATGPIPGNHGGMHGPQPNPTESMWSIGNDAFGLVFISDQLLAKIPCLP